MYDKNKAIGNDPNIGKQLYSLKVLIFYMCLFILKPVFGGEQYLSIKTNGSETETEIGQTSLSTQALPKACLFGDCAHTGPNPGLWVSPFTHTFIFHRHKGHWGLSLWIRYCRTDMKITSHCFRQGAKTCMPSSCRSSEHVHLSSISKATFKASLFKI